MYGLIAPPPRPAKPAVNWRVVVPVFIVLIALVQFGLILAEYLDLQLPVRLSVKWASSDSASVPAQTPTPDQFDAVSRLTHIPTGFAIHDPNETDNYQWYTEAKLRRLTSCMTRGDCSPNADKVSVVGTRKLG